MDPALCVELFVGADDGDAVDVEQFGELAGTGQFGARADMAFFYFKADGVGDLEIDGAFAVFLQ